MQDLATVNDTLMQSPPKKPKGKGKDGGYRRTWRNPTKWRRKSWNKLSYSQNTSTLPSPTNYGNWQAQHQCPPQPPKATQWSPQPNTPVTPQQHTIQAPNQQWYTTTSPNAPWKSGKDGKGKNYKSGKGKSKKEGQDGPGSISEVDIGRMNGSFEAPATWKIKCVRPRRCPHLALLFNYYRFHTSSLSSQSPSASNRSDQMARKRCDAVKIGEEADTTGRAQCTINHFITRPITVHRWAFLPQANILTHSSTFGDMITTELIDNFHSMTRSCICASDHSRRTDIVEPQRAIIRFCRVSLVLQPIRRHHDFHFSCSHFLASSSLIWQHGAERHSSK